MNLSKLSQVLNDQPKYRLAQAQTAVYHNLITNWQQATALPPALRQKLAKECPLAINAKTTIDKKELSVKALVTLGDGLQIETVLLQHTASRNTICLSTQVGCPLNCAFCATGKMGLQRNLTDQEIIEQVLFFARYLKTKGQKVTNLVLMGMGEPLLNYTSVMSAIKFMNSPAGFNIGARHISISTAGIIPGIKKLADEPLQINLAWSLQAPNDKLRAELMPIERQYPMHDVIDAINDYIKKSSRRVMLEYLMLAGINDTEECARQLVEVVKKIYKQICFVNLIIYNPTGVFRPSRADQIKKFKEILQRNGVHVLQRYKFGQEIKAACGQLATKRKF